MPVAGTRLLDLETDAPEQFEGRGWEFHGVRYVLGRRAEGGRDWQTHLLFNQRSKLALHLIQVPVFRNEGVRQALVGMTMAPPKPVPGSMRFSTSRGAGLLHPLSHFVHLDSAVAAAWAEVPSRGTTAERVAAYHAVLKLSPHHSEARLALAGLAVQASAWEQALQLASECMDIDINWLPHLSIYLQCCQALGRVRLAVQGFERLSELFPGQEPCELGVSSYLAVGEVGAAARLVAAAPPEEAEKLAPLVAREKAAHEQVQPLLDEAYRQVAAGHDEAALRALSAAWRMQPHAPWLRFNLALALWRTQRLYEAWGLAGPLVNLAPVEFMPKLGLHLAALSVQLGWLPNALLLVGEVKLTAPLCALRWWDDNRHLAESTPRSLRTVLLELASTAVRLRANIPGGAADVFRRYGLAHMAFRRLADGFQIEEPLGPTSLRVRGIHSGVEYFVRLVLDHQVVGGRPDHPHLLAPLFVRRVEPGWAVFFEYMEGGTLAEWLQAGDQPQAVRVARQIGSALQALHAAGRQHGAVNPQHVLMTRDGLPCLSLSLIPQGPGDTAGWLACLVAMTMGQGSPEIVQMVADGASLDDAMRRLAALDDTELPMAGPARPMPGTIAECMATGDYRGAIHFGASGRVRSTAERLLGNLSTAREHADLEPDPVDAALARAALLPPEEVEATLRAVLPQAAPGEPTAALRAALANAALQGPTAAAALAECEAGLQEADVSPHLRGRLLALQGLAQEDVAGVEAGLALLQSDLVSIEAALLAADLLWYVAGHVAADEALGWYEKTARALLDLLVPHGRDEAVAPLAACFARLGELWSAAGQHHAALDYAWRALRLRRGLAENGGEAATTALAASLRRMADVVRAAGLEDVARRHLAEADTLSKG